jgi:hypothetical protein
MSDRQGKLHFESIRGVHLFFQLTSNTNGTLGSVLVAHTTALLENAVVECHAAQTARLTVRLACKCNCNNNIIIMWQLQVEKF